MIGTERLVVRPWREEDVEEFVRDTNTPAVMAHLGGCDPGASGTRATIARQFAYQAERGHCMWLAERTADGAVLGFCGLQPGTTGAIAGEIEIGWRFRDDAWGQGYAREAALASLAWGWTNLDVPRIVAITVPANRASRGLMRRIGMTHRPDMDFNHPLFERGDPLSRHVAYAIDRP